MKRTISLVAVASLLLGGICVGQDSIAVKAQPTGSIPQPPAPAIAPAPRHGTPRQRIFGAGFRISVLDRSSLFLSARPCQWLNLELGGFGSRKKNDWQYTYSYRFQAAADYLLLPGQAVRPFVGLRLSYERYRDQDPYDMVIYRVYDGGSYNEYEMGTTKRVALALGADIVTGRIGLQFGVAPLYDSRTTVTSHYHAYVVYDNSPYSYSYGEWRDISHTKPSGETAVDFNSFFVAVRFLF